MKFALEHFKYAFALLSKNKNIEDELIQTQLKSIWFFTSSISNEFKKNKINYVDRKGLDIPESSDFMIDLMRSHFETGNSQTETKFSDLSYSEQFKKMYYDGYSEKFIFYLEIYNHITAGQSINSVAFLKHLEDSFNIVEGKVNPPYELLNKFMRVGYWHFSNEEIKEKLDELLSYVENGSFGDITSYFNAGTYLLSLVELFNATESEIKAKLIHGLDSYLRSIKLNDYMINEFEMVSGHFDNSKVLKDVKLFVRQKIATIKEENQRLEIEKLESLFKTDMKSFAIEFESDGYVYKNLNKPIFHQFDLSNIRNTIQYWQPVDVIFMCDILHKRYQHMAHNTDLSSELSFLEALKTEVETEIVFLNTILAAGH